MVISSRFVCAIPHKVYCDRAVLLRQAVASKRRTCISPANSAELNLNAAKNVEANVRSELIFRARETVDNKYKLCQTASKATRRLHIAATNTADTINDAFSRIAGGDDSSIPANPILASS
ncbi:MAG: hypothetical protein JWQ49_2038 [Edaphobacter sp.]|nr:hypothetical protein [Edaphobacter sp.]